MAVRGLDLQMASMEVAGFAAKTTADRDREIGLYLRVRSCPAGHRHRSDAIEFESQRLPFLPAEEFGERHASRQREVHAILVYQKGGSVAIEKAKQTASALPGHGSAPTSGPMNLSALRASLDFASPPAGLDHALRALRLDAKGD
jgi:hypothetical protein